MKELLLYLFLFLGGCMLGYGLEALFRRFVSAKKWVNPGFMKGPWLPLYGFGLVVLFTLANLFLHALPDLAFYSPLKGRGPSVYDLIPMVCMGVAMNVLELLAGLIFVKGFKVRLWDYTNMKGNFLGILCPVFAVIWFALSIIYYYALHPFVDAFAAQAYDFMFGTEEGAPAHFTFIFLLGIFYGVFLIDLVHSIGLFSKVAKLAKESPLSARYEELRQNWNKLRKETGERFFHSLPEKAREGWNKFKDGPKKTDAVKRKVAEIVLIDPDKKESTKDNYDESGRPKKEE